MFKTFTYIAAAAAALTSTIGMAADGDQRFTHDGQTYVYTSVVKSGGRTVIDGHAYPAGSDFHLVVRGDRVSGTTGGVPVSFQVAKASGAREVAARCFQNPSGRSIGPTISR